MKKILYILFLIPLVTWAFSVLAAQNQAISSDRSIKAKEYHRLPVYEESVDFNNNAPEELEERCFNNGTNDISNCRYSNRIQYEEGLNKGMRDNTGPHFTPPPANQKPVF